MVKQHQLPRVRLGRERDGLDVRGVAPATIPLELAGRVHGVVDQHVRVARERDEFPMPRGPHVVAPSRSELVVRHVHQTRPAALGREAVGERGPRVAEPHGLDPEPVHGECPRLHMRHRQRGIQLVERDREHDRIHLLAQDSFQIHLALPGAPNAHGAPGVEQWREERQALNVIPVGVREEEVHLDRVPKPLDQGAPQRANAGARVENDQSPRARGVGLHGDAGRVAPVARRPGSRRGNRATSAPDREPVRHDPDSPCIVRRS
jgi:hypothetical protein